MSLESGISNLVGLETHDWRLTTGDLRLDSHNHLAFTRPVKFTKKDSLPTSEQQFPAAEGNCHRRTNQSGFDVRVGIFLAVAKVHAVLGNQSAEGVQHVARHVGVGILINC